ncbi:hypothetical protein, partial [Klebsiella quasipneumoniae]|uniref:hypothetical protein n=1 Tax=Klebsiella quasipneumoniae TaxID=1463165 RepID=UPI0021D84F0E
TQPATGETYPKSDLFNKALFLLLATHDLSESRCAEMVLIPGQLICPGFPGGLSACSYAASIPLR